MMAIRIPMICKTLRDFICSITPGISAKPKTGLITLTGINGGSSVNNQHFFIAR